MREISENTIRNKFRDLNPHWQSGEVDSEFIAYRKRKYFDLFFPLVHDRSVRRAVVLMGPRRVGKTVMLYQTIQELINEGEAPGSILYLPLDTPLLQGRPLDELVTLFREIRAENSLAGCTIIFDEVQYLNGWSNHLKVLVDQYRETRFIASGSAAAALRFKSQESGAGRFTDFTLPPLTFYEFLDLQGLTEGLFHESDEGYQSPKDIAALNAEFINYINYGGYPEAVFNEKVRENPERFIRSDIVDKVLLRDLPSLYGIGDVQELTRFFNTLAYQTGHEVTYEKLSRSSGIAKNSVKKYIEYLEAAFLIKTLRRVDGSGKTFKRVDFFKVYLTNPSIYSALFGLVGADDAEMGSLVETAMLSQMMHDESAMTRLFYARWARGADAGEVDFVSLDARFRVAGCIEVKWSDRYVKNPAELKSLARFARQTEHKSAVVTTRTATGIFEISEGLEVVFTPAAFACHFLGKDILEDKVIDLEAFLRQGERLSRLSK